MLEDIKTDYPSTMNTEYGEDCCCKEELDALCKDKTVKDLRDMGSYLQRCADKMSSTMDKTVTVEDFENRMKPEETKPSYLPEEAKE